MTTPVCHPNKKHEARGLCKACFENLRIYGDPAKRSAKIIRDREWCKKNYVPRPPKKRQGPPNCHPDRKPAARGMCISCYRKWWRHEQSPNYYTYHNAKSKYKLTPEQHDKLLQRKFCSICGLAPQHTKIRNLVIDHDANTGKVRGVLCRSCNTRLGWFEKRRPEVMEYLNEAQLLL